MRVNLWLHDNLDFHNRLSIHLEEFPDSRSSIFLNCQKVDKKISTWALFLSTKYDIYYEALEKTQNFHFCQFFKYFTIFRKLVIKFDLGGLRFLTRLFRCAWNTWGVPIGASTPNNSLSRAADICTWTLLVRSINYFDR